MKKIIATAAAIGLSLSACESTQQEAPVNLSPSAVASPNQSRNFGEWGVGQSQGAIARDIGSCTLERGGLIWLDDFVNLIYDGRDASQVGPECPDGAILDPKSVDFDGQARIYIGLSRQLGTAAGSPSWRPFVIENGSAQPIHVGGREGRPFQYAGDTCFINSPNAEPTPLRELGKLSTDETLVQVDPDAIQSSANACAPGTYFLLNSAGQPEV